MNSKKKTFAVISIMLLAFPLIAGATSAAVFENPLATGMTPTIILQRLINYILSLLGFIALLALVYGGIIIVIGGMKSEQDLNRGKQIIFWAIIGLLIVGVAALILGTIRYLLGLPPPGP